MGIPLRLVVIALPSFRNGKRIAVSSVDRGCDGIRGAVLLLNLQFYGLRLLLFRISPGAAEGIRCSTLLRLAGRLLHAASAALLRTVRAGLHRHGTARGRHNQCSRSGQDPYAL